MNINKLKELIELSKLLDDTNSTDDKKNKNNFE
jgi:hypothetical protein